MAVMAKAQGVEIGPPPGPGGHSGPGGRHRSAHGAALTPGAQTPATIGLGYSWRARAHAVPLATPGRAVDPPGQTGVQSQAGAGARGAAGGITTTMSWLSYGGALWLLAHGLFETTTLTIGAAWADSPRRTC